MRSQTLALGELRRAQSTCSPFPDSLSPRSCICHAAQPASSKATAIDDLRAADTIFVERLWRSVKCEEVYLNDYQDVADARTGIAIYLDKYNHKRPHQTLGFQTPAAFYEFEMSKTAMGKAA